MKTLRTVEEVKDRVRRAVSRQRHREGELDLAVHRDEIETLLRSFDEFLPIWTAIPCVFRVARIETGGTTVAFTDNIGLPAAKHTMQLVVEMLGYIRQTRGLPEVQMPLFLQPDDIAFAFEEPAACHCDEEQEVAARARSLKRLGQRASKRWLYTGQDVLDRDKRTCTRCGARKDLHVHAVGGGKKWTDIAGYITLCRRCHVVEGGAPSPAAAALHFHLEDGRIDGSAIRSQLALVFQQGALNWVGLALGKEYVVLTA